MATIATGGVTVPAWALATLTGVLLTVMVTIAGSGLVVWRDVHDASVINSDQDRRIDEQSHRIDALEPIKAQVAGIDAKMTDLQETAKSTNKKIDLLLSAELNRPK